MIVGAILRIVASILHWLAGLLPIGTLALPVSGTFAQWIGSHIGPADQFLPIHEAFQGLVVIFSVWAPAAVVFTVVEWCYRHIPFLGRG